MTDEEVICKWMEPDYKHTYAHPGYPSNGGWWRRGRIAWFHQELTLDRLREVESRLTYEQQPVYCEAMRRLTPFCHQVGTWYYLHATVEQKIKALAEVIRRERGIIDK